MSVQGHKMSRHDASDAPGRVCEHREGTGLGEKLPKRLKHSGLCGVCDGIGFHDVDPFQTSLNLPGTTGRVGVMAARYRAGLPIWNDADRRTDDEPPVAEVVGCQLSVFSEDDFSDDDFEECAA